MTDLQPGALVRQKLLDEGQNPGLVDQWMAGQRQQMIDGGQPVSEVDNYWGLNKPPPDMSRTTAAIQSHLGNQDPNHVAKTADSLGSAFGAGFAGSVSGLAISGHMPETEVGENAGLWYKTAAAAGGLIGSLPTLLVGGAMGAPEGGPVGAGAGAMALTAVARGLLVDHYTHPNGVKDWNEFLERATGIVKDAAIDAATGAVMGPAGELGGKFAGAFGSVALGTAAAVGVGSGLHGEVPSADDFIVNAALMVGGGVLFGFGQHPTKPGEVKPGGRFVPSDPTKIISENAMDNFKELGITPEQQRVASERDPVLSGEVIAPRAADGTRVTPGLDAIKPPEPMAEPPYQPTKPELREKNAEGVEEPIQPKHVTEEDIPKSVLDMVTAVKAAGPDEARLYGFKPGEDTAAVEKAQVADLARKYNGNVIGMTVAKGIGTQRADAWIKSGGSFDELPIEVQKALQAAEVEGQISDHGFNDAQENKVLGLQGDNTYSLKDLENPGYPREDINAKKGYEMLWAMWDKYRFAQVTTLNAGHRIQIANPKMIAGYLIKWAEKARFKFMFGPPTGTKGFEGYTPANYQMKSADGKIRASVIYFPTNEREAFMRWYGAEPERIMAHEVAHAIDGDLHGGITGTIIEKPGPVRDEMLAASQEMRPRHWKSAETDPKTKKYVNSPEELWADAAGAWLTDPSRRAKMPEFTAKYGKILEPYLKDINDNLPTRREDGTWKIPEDQPVEPKLPKPFNEGAPPQQPPQPPESGAGGGQPPPQQPPIRYADAAADAAYQNMLAEAKPTKSGLPDEFNARKLIANFDSVLAGARRVDRAFGFAKEGNMGVEDLLRWTFGSATRATQFLRTGVLNAITHELTSRASYVAALEDVKAKGGNLDEWLQYRVAQRTIEKAHQNIETGLPLDAAINIVNREGWAAKYDEGIRILNESKDGLVDYVRDSGVYSEAQAVAMKALNRFHIVLRRVVDPDYLTPQEQNAKAKPGTGTGTGIFRTKDPTKRMEGSQKQWKNLMEAEMDNYHTMVAMADRNRSLSGIIDHVNALNGTVPTGNAVTVFERVHSEEIMGTDETGKILRGTVLDADGNELPPEVHAALAPLLMERKLRTQYSSPNDFVVFKDGKAEVWRSKSDELTKSLQAMWTSSKDPIPNLFAKFARLQMTGIVGSLDFPFRAILHGQLAAAAFAPGKFMMPFHDIIKGTLDVIHNGTSSEAYQRFLSEGGADAAMVDINRRYLATDMEKVFDETGTSNAMLNSAKHPLEAMRTASHYIDQMARYGRYLGNVEGGLSPGKAAMIARVSHLDYKEQFGANWLNTWSRMVPFMSTGFKDIEQVYRGLRDDPVGTAMKAAVVLTAPTIMNWAANYLADQGLEDKDKYGNIPQWERDMYWVTPPIFGGPRMKIKRPYVGAYLFSTGPERFLDWLVKNEPSTAKSLAEAAYSQMSPPWMPSLVQPVLQQWANKAEPTNPFSSRPLIPYRLENVAPPLQYTPDTTEVAKAVGRTLNISPITFQTYMKDWFGPLPMTVEKLLEAPFKPIGKPWEPADIPFLGSFLTRHAISGQTLEDFYDKSHEITEAHASLRLAIKTGDLSLIHDYQTQQAAIRIGGAQKAISGYTSQLRAIDANQTMTPDEKRKYTDMIATQMTAIAKNAVDFLDKAKLTGRE